MDFIKSITFKSLNPEECWRQYQNARLTPDFDDKHYPELDHFWYREDYLTTRLVPGKGTNIAKMPIFTLVVIYGRDLTPNM